MIKYTINRLDIYSSYGKSDIYKVVIHKSNYNLIELFRDIGSDIRAGWYTNGLFCGQIIVPIEKCVEIRFENEVAEIYTGLIGFLNFDMEDNIVVNVRLDQNLLSLAKNGQKSRSKIQHRSILKAGDLAE